MGVKGDVVKHFTRALCIINSMAKRRVAILLIVIVCDAVIRTFLAAVSVKKISRGRYLNVRSSRQ